VDGTLGLSLDPLLAATAFRLQFSWYNDGSADDVSNSNGDISLRLFLGTMGSQLTVTIVNVIYEDTGLLSTASFLGLNQTITAGSGEVEYITLNPSSAIFLGGFPTSFDQFTHTSIDFLITGGTIGTTASQQLFSIDAIATSPEPGTLALFGMGALGLIGLVRRRRARRRRDQSAATLTASSSRAGENGF
jgi:hypothetical protein